MGNFCSSKHAIMTDLSSFDKNRTICLSGVSQLLYHLIARHIQSRSSGFDRDVSKVYVCPDAKDCVLVELTEGQVEQGKPIESIQHLRIDGTSLRVTRLSSSTSGTEESVARVWPNEEEEITCSHNVNDDRWPSDRQNGIIYNSGDPSPSLFEEIQVKLSTDLFQEVVEKNLAEKYLGNEEVKLDKKTGYLSGSWAAVCSVVNRLYCYFSGVEDSRSAASLDTATRACGGTCSEDWVKDSIAVQSLCLRYILAYHYNVFQELEKVSSKIEIEMVSRTEKNLQVFASGNVDKKLFKSEVEKFITFYQELYAQLHCENFPANLPANSSLDEDISFARARFSVLVSRPKQNNQIKIYGKKDDVAEASTFLKDKLPDVASKVVSHSKQVNLLSCNLTDKVKVLVYQGDITEERVDAIVNPANQNLRHCGGAAYAISQRGGTSIQAQSDDIMRRRRGRPLQAGDVEVTTAGNLPCKFIIHAVGPQWDYHSKTKCRELLRKAVLQSLRVACQNQGKTISLPAISSGVFRVPTTICAEVLFGAVEEFVTGQQGANSLEEVHFVNIDQPTVQVFERAMKKRYKNAVELVTRTETGVFTGSRRSLRMAVKDDDDESPVSVENFQQNVKRNHSGSPTGMGGQHVNQKGRTFGGTDQSASRPDSTPPSKDGSSVKTPPTYSQAVSGKPTSSKDDTTSADTSKCSICLDDMTDPKTLDKCKHSFCKGCIENAFKHQAKCPICSEVYGVITGNQPEGRMSTSTSPMRLPGYDNCGTIKITYDFPSGTQGPNHPNPGRRYTGTCRCAYLPDNEEGRKVLRLLRKSFDQKLTFRIGVSTTTGTANTVIWNDIHHKTSTTGGSTYYGYPDPTYLKRVQEELAAKGIKE